MQYATARERFEHTAYAVKRLNDVKLLLMTNGDDWKPESVHVRSDKSDPTANQAAYNVDVLGEKLTALRAEEAELEGIIGEALVIIEAVRDNLGEQYALMLEARYIDRLSWTMIDLDYGFSRSSGSYLVEIAFNWIDSVGVANIFSGNFEL